MINSCYLVQKQSKELKLIFIKRLCVQDGNAKMFITAKIYPVLIFLFSCFSYLEQLGYDLLGAVETGNVGMVGQLLSLGVSPDVRSSDTCNRTPLHEAAINNRSCAIINYP